MYAKLAWRNIRRSLRDYGIYFLTLVFAVAIFYLFNSISDQPAFLAMRTSTRRMAEGAMQALSSLTIIMTGVVALLVLYANRVIARKRSRELGTYLLLGMEPGRLAFLLLGESAIIGLAALVVGLAGGIALSQVFALGVSRLFAVTLTRHAFVFSPSALWRTLLCYGLTFLLVALWQAAALYRQKLIDLIQGMRQNEEIRLRSRSLSGVAGMVSLILLGGVYRLADQVSRTQYLSPRDSRIWMGVALAAAATYLLFFAAAGLLTGVRGRQSGWMGRGLNRFIFRQVTSKINTHAATLATIALMLTVTICAMSFGLGLGRGVLQGADREAPFDYLFASSTAGEDFGGILALFDQHGVTERQMVRFQTAAADLQGRDLMLPEDLPWFAGDGPARFVAEVQATVIPASAYRQLRALKGYAAADLAGGSFLLHAPGAQTEPERRAQEAFQRFLASGSAIALEGRKLQPGAAQVFTEPLSGAIAGPAPLLVVPDDVADGLPLSGSYLALAVAEPAPEALDQAIMNEIRNERKQQEGRWLSATIRADVMANAYGIEGMLVFLAFYLGLMFILISATLLSLHQVTDAVEHRQRFEVLRKLGADDQSINGAIARQLALYFLTPVAVALLHSLVAMVALARQFRVAAGLSTVWPATTITLTLFCLIYGAYFLLSLQSCRTLFKEPQPR